MNDSLSSRTGLVFDDCFRGHDGGSGHPERPERLVAIGQAFEKEGVFEACPRIEPVEATDEQIEAIHDAEYVARFRRACAAGQRVLDATDCLMCEETYRLARLAAGSILAAVDRVMTGELANAFCAVRPPGHHCERDRAMGFCFLANVAIAARHLIDGHGLSRVAVVDFDVHHGNGTQHLFEESSEVLVCNLHGHPSFVYPGTGFEEERGRGDGDGATLNVCMVPGAGDDAYRKAFDERVLPALEDYKPQFILVSAGFDAHRRDPLAPINLDTESYDWMTRAITDVAARCAGGRLVSALEGGYDLEALAASSVLHVQRLIDAGSATKSRQRENRPG